MTNQEKEWMQRYIYQVTRRLPRAQRREAALELEELIGDMLEDMGDIQAVLTHLGDPAVYAAQRRGVQPYLIGPAYYDAFIFMVRVVLLCALIPIFVIGVVQAALHAHDTLALLVGVGSCVIETLSVGVSVFGALTAVFAVLQRRNVRVPAPEKAAWTPAALSSVPHPKARIDRGDCIVGIVFSVLFGVLLIFAPQFFSIVYRVGDGVRTIALFNLAAWDAILPVFLLCLAAGMIDEIVRLTSGVYSRTVLVSSVLCTAVQIALYVLLFRVLPLWNPMLTQELVQAFPQAAAYTAYASYAPQALLALFTLFCLLETGTTLYRTLRYGAGKKDMQG